MKIFFKKYSEKIFLIPKRYTILNFFSTSKGSVWIGKNCFLHSAGYFCTKKICKTRSSSYMFKNALLSASSQNPTLSNTVQNYQHYQTLSNTVQHYPTLTTPPCACSMSPLQRWAVLSKNCAVIPASSCSPVPGMLVLGTTPLAGIHWTWCQYCNNTKYEKNHQILLCSDFHVHCI